MIAIPVYSLQSSFDLQLCVKIVSQCYMNLSTVGKLNFVPTRSKVCEKQPISITVGYIMVSVHVATPFTDARSCIATRGWPPPIPSSVERAVKSSVANSSPDSDLLRIAILTKHCLMHPSEKNLSTIPYASPRRVDPS